MKASRGVVLLAERPIEARRYPRRGHHLQHLFERQAGLGRDLLVRGFAAEPGSQPAMHSGDLALARIDLMRQADPRRTGLAAALGVGGEQVGARGGLTADRWGAPCRTLCIVAPLSIGHEAVSPAPSRRTAGIVAAIYA
jgi:hypothetical protein